MWRYKLTCLCGGWGTAVFSASILVMWLLVKVLDGIVSPLTEFAVLLGTPVVGYLLAFIVTHLPGAEDERCIMNAKPLQWEKLPPNSLVVKSVHRQSKRDFITFLAISIFLGLCGGFYAFTALAEPGARIPAVILLLIAAVFFLTGWVRFSFWSKCTDNAEYAAVNVAYCRRIPKFNYRIRRNRYMAVFFLPDGKFRVALYASQPPQVLYFVRFKGSIRRFPQED